MKHVNQLHEWIIVVRGKHICYMVKTILVPRLQCMAQALMFFALAKTPRGAIG